MTDPITRLNGALEGRYRIERQLGEGGMATVYLARDEKHNRNVALKVLKPELAAVVGAERFLAEIETTANLQHPHILPLFDSGEADSFLFYVMPYVDGESLRERLDREHQLPVDEAVAIAKNVAEALDYAHRQGVIHRDIKPANILLQDGKPVVSDFGIALAVGAAGGGRLTETGLSLGTPHYMSPEQATGDLSVGLAADIYALGCVLYEMLVGDPPYTGSTAQAVLGKIVTGDADPVTKHRRMVPANVDAAIRKALEKLPADRFAGAHDFAKALAEASFRHGEAAIGSGSSEARPWKAVALGASAVATVLAGALLWSLSGPDEVPEEIVRFVIPLADSLPINLPGSGHDLAISADGRMIVYQASVPGGGTQFQIRPLDQLESAPIRGTERAYEPTFSPDGEWIAFSISGPQRVLHKVSVLGGAPVTLAELPEDSNRQIWGMSWGDDDRIIVGTARGGLARVPAGGGEFEDLTTPDADREGESHVWPAIIPGRNAVLFAVETLAESGAPSATGQLAILDLETGEVRQLGVAGVRPRYLSSGYIAYAVEDGTVRGVPFDVDALEVTGSPVPLLEGIVVKNTGASNFDVSRNGRLVYLRGNAADSDRTLVWVDRQGREEAIAAPPLEYRLPRLSPDGGRVALDVGDDDSDEVRVWDFQAETLTRLTLGDGAYSNPVWSPDGSRIAYQTANSGSIHWKTANNTGEPEVLVDSLAERVRPVSFTPDGSAIALQYDGPGNTRWDLAMVSLASGRSAEITWRLNTEYDERNPVLSPDGHWLAYESDESGRYQIHVRPSPDVQANQVQVSNASVVAVSPVWSKDGRELFYFEPLPAARLVSISFDADPGTGRFEVVSRNVVLDWPYFSSPGLASTYDVSPDGSRFLAITQAGSGGGTQPEEITVVDNWLQHVRERVPTN